LRIYTKAISQSLNKIKFPFCFIYDLYLYSNDWTEFTITNDDKTLFSVNKDSGMTTIESLTVTNELQGALIESLKARIATLEVIS
jgi:hypothetical protein